MIARFAVACFGIIAVLPVADAHAAGPPKAVLTALSQIKSIVGDTVLERMQLCGIKFADGSYAEKATSDYPDRDAHKGDMLLDVYVDVPPLPGEDPGAYQGLLARWVISHGVAHPINGWAKWLQDKPIPIGSSEWMNC